MLIKCLCGRINPSCLMNGHSKKEGGGVRTEENMKLSQERNTQTPGRTGVRVHRPSSKGVLKVVMRAFNNRRGALPQIINDDQLIRPFWKCNIFK